MIPLLRGQRQAHSPSAGTAESQMHAVTSELGIGRAATLLKTLLQYYGKSLEALPGVAYPGFRDNRSTLNTKTGYKKNKVQRQLHCHIERYEVGTLDVDGWTVTFEHRGPPRCSKCRPNSPPINVQCTNFLSFNVPITQCIAV